MKTVIDARSKDGCTYYRLKQPGRILTQKYPHLFTVLETGDDYDHCDTLISHTDCIWVGKGIPESGAWGFERMQKAGKLVFYDLDDNLFRISPFNPAYMVLGTREVPGLWKDGQEEFDSKRNADNLVRFMDLLKSLDGITVSTNNLARVYGPFNPKTVVLPNCIDFQKWPLIDHRKGGPVRIGYQGGDSHYEDWWEIKDGLTGLTKEIGDRIRLVWAGQFYEAIFEGWDPDLIELHGWVHVEAHSYRMCSLNLDIGLVPLKDTEFNHGKSALKWMEYAAMKVPAVCSDVPPYNQVVRHGETGFLAGSEGEFIHYLRVLIDDPILRADMGRRAYEQVYEEYNAETRAETWLKAVDWMAEGVNGERATAG